MLPTAVPSSERARVRPRRVLAVAAVVVSALVGPARAPAVPIDVTTTARDFSFSFSPDDLAAGEHRFRVTNVGGAPHQLRVVGPGVDALSDALATGQSDDVTATLAVGTYRLYCPIGNHAARGMDYRKVVSAAPAAVLEAPTVAARSATLRGTVDPNNAATTYRFEYGPTAAYGSRTADVELPAGDVLQTVTADVAGLTPATTYQVRLVAVNARGSAETTAGTFTTGAEAGPAVPFAPAAPQVSTSGATAVRARSATLTGVADTRGLAGSYRFEYGTTTAYGLSSPAVPLPASGGARTVSADVGALLPSTTYHYRIAVTTTAGTTLGADATFTTAAGGAAVVDRRAPRASVAAPACRGLRPAACRAVRARVAAWRVLRGTVRDGAPSAGIRRVEVNLVRSSPGGCRVYRGRRFLRLPCAAARSVWVRVALDRQGRTWTLRVRALAPGRYALRVRATDRAGNVGRPTAARRLVLRA